MISEEINIYGFIKIPYPYLNEYLEKISELKKSELYTNFPDFLMPPLNCIGNAMSSFGYTMRYEGGFEVTLIERFESFLSKIKFLFATLIIDIESKQYFFNEYVFDGEKIVKIINKVSSS